jgi:hypothetical protein
MKYQKAIFDLSIMIVRTDDDDKEMWIPPDELNCDYQKYLAWVAEGNTAEEWTGN